MMQQLTTSDLNKYEVLLTSGKWNGISPKKEHIVALSIVVEI